MRDWRSVWLRLSRRREHARAAPAWRGRSQPDRSRCPVTSRILHEVQRHPECVVKLESLAPRRSASTFADVRKVSESFSVTGFSTLSSSSASSDVPVSPPRAVVRFLGFLSPIPACARIVFPPTGQSWTRSVDSFSSGYASCIRSRTANTILWRNGFVCPSNRPWRDCTSDDFAQDIAAAFVRWQHSIGDQERRRPRVVRDHAQ